MSKLRWKLNPSQALRYQERSSTLHDGDLRYAIVSPASSGAGWYWVAGWESAVPHHNTHDRSLPTCDEAKAAALSYVKQHLSGTASSKPKPPAEPVE